MKTVSTKKVKRIRSAVIVAAASAVLIGLSACSGGSSAAGPDGDPQSITFGVGAPVLIDSTAPYASVPKKLRYWKDQGLDVTVQPTQGATASVQLLLAGKADVINGGTSAFYQAAAKAPNLRVISLGTANIWQVTVPEGSPVKSIAELKGKTIGVQSLTSASYLFGRAAVEASGLNPDTDVKWLPVGVGNQAAQAFTSSAIAAYATYEGPSGVIGNMLGKKLVNLPTPLDEVPGLLGIATTEEFLTKHRDVLVKFLVGLNKGAVFAGTSPSAALQIQWAESPEQKPKANSDAEAISAALPGVDTRYISGAQPGATGELGVVPMPDVQKSIDFMVEHGVLEKSLKASQYVDLSVAADANDFDTKAVAEQAKSWKP